ncbi:MULTISPECIES: DUF6088 family protein [Paraburkholderia]|uniref:DUF6088 family protein n=1 Tax=Paraburkholderia TaxID=1822464 RepID=UPI00037C1C1D|nr:MULTISPECIES: DUF6088 family protein [Paraburkholderia]MDH6149547.1 hypothetical protein [Paraburkholderia sp. WSM4179]
MKLEDRVTRSIGRRKGAVILRRELERFGSPAQLSRVLARLVGTGALVRVSRGVYAKTRRNKFTGDLTPAGTLESIAAETFRKLGIAIKHGKLGLEYNSGRSTQVPMLAVVNTGNRRITRKIQVGRRTLTYERDRALRRKEAKQ